MLDQLIQRAAKTERGFTDIKRAAEEIVAQTSPAECLAIAHDLYKSDVHQARMLAVFLLGYAAPASPQVLEFMREVVSHDPNWRVQEILAQGFDMYCAAIGYELSLPLIQNWLNHPIANVRRAVTEGLRIWTRRPFFREHPEVAINLLSQQKDQESDYLRKSAGNALRDISRQHPDLVREELKTWDISNKRIALVYKLASKFLEGD